MTNPDSFEPTFRYSESQGPVPLLVYSAGIQVVVAWLCLLGAYLSVIAIWFDSLLSLSDASPRLS